MDWLRFLVASAAVHGEVKRSVVMDYIRSWNGIGIVRRISAEPYFSILLGVVLCKGSKYWIVSVSIRLSVDFKVFYCTFLFLHIARSLFIRFFFSRQACSDAKQSKVVAVVSRQTCPSIFFFSALYATNGMFIASFILYFGPIISAWRMYFLLQWSKNSWHAIALCLLQPWQASFDTTRRPPAPEFACRLRWLFLFGEVCDFRVIAVLCALSLRVFVQVLTRRWTT